MCYFQVISAGGNQKGCHTIRMLLWTPKLAHSIVCFRFALDRFRVKILVCRVTSHKHPEKLLTGNKQQSAARTQAPHIPSMQPPQTWFDILHH